MTQFKCEVEMVDHLKMCMNVNYLNMTSCGTLHVRTAHDRKYIRIPNFTKLRMAKPGAKNMPIHT